MGLESNYFARAFILFALRFCLIVISPLLSLLFCTTLKVKYIILQKKKQSWIFKIVLGVEMNTNKLFWFLFPFRLGLVNVFFSMLFSLFYIHFWNIWNEQPIWRLKFANSKETVGSSMLLHSWIFRRHFSVFK